MSGSAMSGTEQFYSSHAAVYANDPRVLPHPWRDRFLASLASGASILELGCGGAHDTQRMIDAGLAVTPTDGVAEIAAEAAQRLGMPVQVLRFEDIAFEATTFFNKNLQYTTSFTLVFARVY